MRLYSSVGYFLPRPVSFRRTLVTTVRENEKFLFRTLRNTTSQFFCMNILPSIC